MVVGFDRVSYIIVKSGTISIDGIEYTETIDCRELEGLHHLQATGEWSFREMTKADYYYIKNKKIAEKKTQIADLTVEVLEKEYQLTTGEVL